MQWWQHEERGAVVCQRRRGTSGCDGPTTAHAAAAQRGRQQRRSSPPAAEALDPPRLNVDSHSLRSSMPLAATSPSSVSVGVGQRRHSHSSALQAGGKIRKPKNEHLLAQCCAIRSPSRVEDACLVPEGYFSHVLSTKDKNCANSRQNRKTRVCRLTYPKWWEHALPARGPSRGLCVLSKPPPSGPDS